MPVVITGSFEEEPAGPRDITLSHTTEIPRCKVQIKHLQNL